MVVDVVGATRRWPPMPSCHTDCRRRRELQREPHLVRLHHERTAVRGTLAAACLPPVPQLAGDSPPCCRRWRTLSTTRTWNSLCWWPPLHGHHLLAAGVATYRAAHPSPSLVTQLDDDGDTHRPLAASRRQRRPPWAAGLHLTWSPPHRLRRLGSTRLWYQLLAQPPRSAASSSSHISLSWFCLTQELTLVRRHTPTHILRIPGPVRDYLPGFFGNFFHGLQKLTLVTGEHAGSDFRVVVTPFFSCDACVDQFQDVFSLFIWLAVLHVPFWRGGCFDLGRRGGCCFR